MTYTLTALQVEAALAGHNLRTYKGWIAAAKALLADAPEWTGIRQMGGFAVKVDGHLYGCAECTTAGHLYTEDDLFDFDKSAWSRDSWDCACADVTSAELTRPVFVALPTPSNLVVIPNPSMTKDEALRVLYAHAERRLDHANAGLCPDVHEGCLIRDTECRVCQALTVLAPSIATPAHSTQVAL